MSRRNKYTFATTDLGCPHPDEYDLKSQMDQYCAIYENGLHSFINTDAGKFIGLAKAYLDIKENVVLGTSEVAIVNKLLAGYVVGPEGQKVLDKLKGIAGE